MLQGKVDSISAYEPQDLFSGNARKMQQALHCLLRSPQNNIAVHITDDGPTQPRPAARGSSTPDSVSDAVNALLGAEGSALSFVDLLVVWPHSCMRCTQRRLHNICDVATGRVPDHCFCHGTCALLPGLP